MLPEGVITATLTPMDSGLRVDQNKLLKHIQWLYERGSNGICLLGTTGEANSLSSQDRRSTVEFIANADINKNEFLSFRRLYICLKNFIIFFFHINIILKLINNESLCP